MTGSVRTALSRVGATVRAFRLPRASVLARGPALGVLLVLVFSAGLLLSAFRASDRHYERRLVAADTSYYMSGPAIIVSGKRDFGIRRVMTHFAPLPSSDGGTTVYVLQTLSAWYLRDFLPLRPSMAVVLNSAWFLAMGLSLYAVFWSRMNQWTTSALATLAYLVANPFLPTVTYGITSLDPNLVGFMLGTSVLCCTVLSERFTRVVPCLLVGVFLGLLCLGRIYTLGVVLPAMLPYVLSCFWRRSWREMLTSLQGGILALGVTIAISGWFVRGNWAKLITYPTQFGDSGSINHITLADGLWKWLAFPKTALAENLTLACVLSWPLAAQIFGLPRRLRHFNWAALWATLAPLVVLAKMGTTFEPYGAICLFGIFMALLFPFARPDAALLYRGRFAAALAIACAFGCWGFFSKLRAAHEDTSNNKRGTLTALETLRQDALSSGRKRATVGLVHFGALHDASLVDAMIMDMGFRVATPNFQPKQRSTNALIIDPLMPDPWAWDPKVVGSHAITPQSWAARVIQEADYVFVLAGDRRQERREGRWPPWVEASELILNSEVFRRLGPTFWVPSDGSVQLLVRKRPR